MNMFIADYIIRAFSDDKDGAAKSLARGLAIGAIELLFYILTAGSGKGGQKAAQRAVEEGLEAAGKTAGKVARPFSEAALDAGRKLLTNLRHPIQAFMRNGKIIIEAIGERIFRAAASLSKLGESLAERLGMRSWSLRRAGQELRCVGCFNGCIVFAAGTFKTVTKAEYEGVGGAKALVGSEVKAAGRIGLLIGEKDVPSALVRLLEHPPISAGPRFTEEVLDLFNDALRRARASGQNPKLRELLQQTAIDVLKKRSGNVVENVLDGFRRAGIPEASLDKALHALMNDSRSVLTADQMLNRLNQLARLNPKNLDRLIGDLAMGGNKTVGAEWVLRFITESPGARVSAITAFEEFAAGGGRFYDVVMDGMRFEFKNVQEFSGYVRESFMKQILHDFKTFGDLSGNVRWVFAPRVGSKEALLDAMRAALRNEELRAAAKMTEAQASAIEAELNNFVIVGLTR
jgi:hypothetical protein